VFEKRLPDSIEKQPFKKILDVAYVKRVIEEADGIQPHLVAPEAGYRRLLEEALGYLKDPTDKSVEEVSGHTLDPGAPWCPCCLLEVSNLLPGHSQFVMRRRVAAAEELRLVWLLLHIGWNTCFAQHLLLSRTPPRTVQVFVLLRRMVDNVANSEEVRALKRYPTLRREIVTAAYRALEKFKVRGCLAQTLQGGSEVPCRCSGVAQSCGRLGKQGGRRRTGGKELATLGVRRGDHSSQRCSCCSVPCLALPLSVLTLVQVGSLPSSMPLLDLPTSTQEETRKMVLIMVEMERNYITAEYFRTIQV
jgi:hypothetical protein